MYILTVLLIGAFTELMFETVCMYGCMYVLALTKDVDLTISNFLDGRTMYDAAAADDDVAANVINSTNKLTSSTTVRVCLESCVFNYTVQYVQGKRGQNVFVISSIYKTLAILIKFRAGFPE